MQVWAKTLERAVAPVRALIRRHWPRALRLRERFHLSEEAENLALAGGVGVIGGLINLAFNLAFETVKLLALGQSGDLVDVAKYLTWWQRLLAPTLGGLFAGLALHWGLRWVGQQGTTNLLEVVVAGDGRLPFRTAL